MVNPIPSPNQSPISNITNLNFSQNHFFEEDEKWLQIVKNTIQNNLSNNQYTISQLANDVAISERQLRRRLKKLISKGPKQYIRQIRLNKAKTLLIQRKYKTITQVAQAVGYKDIGAFRCRFVELFGKSPKSYL